ncbi:MAG: tyrosine-type recombinase/integrase [Deltaproteobacteria bacterium]|nr:tyrosine-type recombinase/integrase [Deltaproteobacteria bacterium]
MRKAAGLPDNFRVHGLRHNFAGRLVSNGVDFYTVGCLLTHKQTSTTARYAHLSDQRVDRPLNSAQYKEDPYNNCTGREACHRGDLLQHLRSSFRV